LDTRSLGGAWSAPNWSPRLDVVRRDDVIVVAPMSQEWTKTAHGSAHVTRS
jgi:hypothetical protein